jgi:hypothetical protein
VKEEGNKPANDDKSEVVEVVEKPNKRKAGRSVGEQRKRLKAH